MQHLLLQPFLCLAELVALMLLEPLLEVLLLELLRRCVLFG